MIVIENCNSLSELRQKLIDGEEVRTVRQEPCEDVISRQSVLDYIDKMPSELTADGRRMIRRKTLEEYISNTLPPVNIQESKYCDRNVCLKNEYNGIGCDECEVTKSQKQKIGHWIYRIYGEFHEEGNWHCSGCNHIFNGGYGHAEYCPKCGCHMIEAPTEEVNKSYDWIIRR